MSRERLLKLLNLTASDSDGEAMNALRKAQALMKELKIEWKDLLAPVYVVENNIVRHQHPAQNFYAAQAGAPPDFSDVFNQMFKARHSAAQQAQQARRQHVDEIGAILRKVEVVLNSGNVPDITKNLVKQRIEIWKQGNSRLDSEFLEALNVAHGWATGKPYREGASNG